jgi:hypothetical protein
MTLLVKSETTFVVLGLFWLMFACERLIDMARKKRLRCFTVYKFENNLALKIVFVHLIALIVYQLPFNLTLAHLVYFTFHSAQSLTGIADSTEESE